MGYSTLTRYLRNLGLRQPRRGKKVSGEMITSPGVEGQLDTSPVHVRLGSDVVKLHLAHLILGFSRHRYMDFFSDWTRFHAMVFIVRALLWKGTLIQYTGRLHRLHPGKTEVRIYD